MSKNIKKSQPNTTPLNEQKIKGLSNSLTSLPKSGFSRCIVFYCLIAMILIVIAGFVFTYLGHDVDSIVQSSLLACTGELLILGAKKIVQRDDKIQEIVLEEIHKELNDGIEYEIENNSNTNTTTNTGNTTNNYYSVNNTNTNTNSSTNTNTNNSNNSQDSQDDSSFYNTNPDLSEAQGSDEELEELEEFKEVQEEKSESEEIPKPQPKKRGRPKKSTQVKQPKQEEEFVSDWLDEDMSD